MNSAPRPGPLPPLPPLPATWRRDCLWIIAAFVGCRLAVLGIFAARGRAFPFMDADGYIRQAIRLAAHGWSTVPEMDGGRFFSGVPLLVAMAGRITGEFAWTGLAINLVLGIAAALLFYRNVGRRDWALCHAMLLPAWVSMTSTVHSEAGLWCFSLVGLTALRKPLNDAWRRCLWMVAGYAVICRPTAAFILIPMLGLWLLQPAGWRVLIGDAAAAAVMPLLALAWTWSASGSFVPQSEWQAQQYVYWAAYYGGDFPDGVFAWPGQAFVAGLFAPTIPLEIKVLNVLHLAAWGMALWLASQASRSNRDDTLARLTAVELAVNGAFILSIGGPFGHTIYYRFLATQANPFVLLAWLRHAPVPRVWWGVAATTSVALASAAARGA